jgi:hypothetical protein
MTLTLFGRHYLTIDSQNQLIDNYINIRIIVLGLNLHGKL